MEYCISPGDCALTEDPRYRCSACQRYAGLEPKTEVLTKQDLDDFLKDIEDIFKERERQG